MKLRKNILFLFIFFIVLIIVQFVSITSSNNDDVFLNNNSDTSRSFSEKSYIIKLKDAEIGDSSDYYFFNKSRIVALIDPQNDSLNSKIRCFWYLNDSLMFSHTKSIYKNAIIKDQINLVNNQKRKNLDNRFLGKWLLLITDLDLNYIKSIKFSLKRN